MLWCNAALHARRFGRWRCPAELRTSVDAPPTRALPSSTECTLQRRLVRRARRARRRRPAIAWALQDITDVSAQARRGRAAARAARHGAGVRPPRRLGARDPVRRAAAGTATCSPSGASIRRRARPTSSEAHAQHPPEDRLHRRLPRSRSAAPGRYAQRYRVMRPDGTTCAGIHSQWEVKTGAGRPARARRRRDDGRHRGLRAGPFARRRQRAAQARGRAGATSRSGATTCAPTACTTTTAPSPCWASPPRPEGLPHRGGARAHPPGRPARRCWPRPQQALAHRPARPTCEARYRRSDGSWRYVLTRRVVQRDGRRHAAGLPRRRARRDRAGRAAARGQRAGAAAGDRRQRRRRGHLEPRPGDRARRLERADVRARSGCAGRPRHADARRVDRADRPPRRPRRACATCASELLAGADATVEHEYRIVRRDGEVRWLVNRARREPLARSHDDLRRRRST